MIHDLKIEIVWTILTQFAKQAYIGPWGILKVKKEMSVISGMN